MRPIPWQACIAACLLILCQIWDTDTLLPLRQSSSRASAHVGTTAVLRFALLISLDRYGRYRDREAGLAGGSYDSGPTRASEA